MGYEGYNRDHSIFHGGTDPHKVEGAESLGQSLRSTVNPGPAQLTQGVEGGGGEKPQRGKPRVRWVMKDPDDWTPEERRQNDDAIASNRQGNPNGQKPGVKTRVPEFYYEKSPKDHALDLYDKGVEIVNDVGGAISNAASHVAHGLTGGGQSYTPEQQADRDYMEQIKIDNGRATAAAEQARRAKNQKK